MLTIRWLRFSTAEFFLFAILPQSQLLVPTGWALTVLAIGSVLSCRLVLQLRACMFEDGTGDELFSMSVNPTRLGTIMFDEGSQSWTQSRSESDDLELPEVQHEIPTKLPKVGAPV